MILYLATAWAATPACPAWDASFLAMPARGHASSTLSYTWSPVPACDGFSFDHYAVCQDHGALDAHVAPPSTPGDPGVTCETVVPGRRTTRATEWVGRSHTAFAARIFACGDADCTVRYSDVARTTHTAHGVDTATERWVVRGVSGVSDPDRAIPDTDATAATALVYPDGFPDAGHLGVWFSTATGGGQNIRYVRAAVQGWRDWNTGGVAFSAPVDIASSAVGGGAFGWVTHPWVVPAVDAGVPYVRMYVQADDAGDGPDGTPFTVYSVDSVDGAGTDFGLTCGSAGCVEDTGTCAAGEPCDWAAAAVEELGAADGLASASHGSMLFPWLEDEDGAIDFATESPILAATGTSSCGSGADDLFLGDWDGVGWSVPVDGVGCAVPALEDVHDPSAVPLPDGSVKVYMQVGHEGFQVCRAEGTTVSDCVPIELAFDDGTSLGALDNVFSTCAGNFQAFLMDTSPAPRQAALLALNGTGGSCFARGQGGIVVVELRN